MPPKKTVSFEGDSKRTPNWFQRQYSGQMNRAYYSDDGELETAVAAAAYAVSAIEEEKSSLNQMKTLEASESSLTKAKSKKEETMIKRDDSSKLSRWFSGKEAKEDDGKSAGESSMRKTPEKAMSTTPSIKKTPTFSDKYLNDTHSKRFESGKEKKTGPNIPATTKLTASIEPNTGEAKADAWKRAELAKIQERYERMAATILEWETEKKNKAKRRLEQKERELEERRAAAMQEYRLEMSRIDKIAGGAREVADKTKRKDESKTLEKAKVIRHTGKLPRKCFCF